MTIIRNEIQHSINGVAGRLLALSAPLASGVFLNQTWISEGRKVSGYGKNGVMRVKMRFDDNCRNGKMSFAITAEVKTDQSRKMNDIAAGGCMHSEVADVFPELAHFIKWHLCDTDGPMHYLANVVYLAGDRDCNKKRKGEPLRYETKIYFAESPVSHAIKGAFAKFIKSRMIQVPDSTYKVNPEHGEFRVVALAHKNKPGDSYKFKPKFTFAGFGNEWYECPFDDEQTAQEWAYALNSSGCKFKDIPVEFSDGKDRELDEARRAAIWPDATDDELSKEPEELKKALLNRLPGLLADFRATMESAGFLYECHAA